MYKAPLINFSDKKVTIGEDGDSGSLVEMLQNLSRDEMDSVLQGIPEDQKRNIMSEKSKIVAILDNERRELDKEREKFEQDRMKLIELTRKEAEEEKEQLLANAKAESDELIKGIVKEAEERAGKIREEMLENVHKEAISLRESAYKEGFELGRTEVKAKLTEDMQNCINMLESFIGNAEGKMEEFTTSYERDLKWAVLQVARKVLNRMVSEDELNMEDMIIGAVDTVRDADWIDVSVSAESQKLIAALREELSVMDNVGVTSSNLENGNATISTNEDILGISVDKQLDNIEAYFKREYKE